MYNPAAICNTWSRIQYVDMIIYICVCIIQYTHIYIYIHIVLFVCSYTVHICDHVCVCVCAIRIIIVLVMFLVSGLVFFLLFRRASHWHIQQTSWCTSVNSPWISRAEQSQRRTTMPRKATASNTRLDIAFHKHQALVPDKAIMVGQAWQAHNGWAKFSWYG